MNTLAPFYSDPLNINVLKNSSFVKTNSSIQVASLGKAIHSTSKYIFIYTDLHICVLVKSSAIKNGKPIYELYDSYPGADTRISHFIEKSIQLAQTAVMRSQRDENSCVAYTTVYVHLRERAFTHEDAIFRLAALPLITVREMAFRILNILE